MSLSGALVKFGVLAGPGDTYVLLASVLQDARFIDLQRPGQRGS